MSELISGKEALIALANGEDVEVKHPHDNWFKSWTLLNNIGGKIFLSSMLNDDGYQFRLKPRTVNLNGIEVPAPFEPEDGDQFWHLYPSMGRGYNFTVSIDSDHYQQFGAWRTEEEIKQVVAALRSIFNPQ